MAQSASGTSLMKRMAEAQIRMSKALGCLPSVARGDCWQSGTVCDCAYAEGYAATDVC